MTDLPDNAKKRKLDDASGVHVVSSKEEENFQSRISDMLKRSIERLQDQQESRPSKEQIASWATLIFESMSTPERVYHSIEHVFDISKEMKYETDSVAILAALFHDVIYLTIDHRLSTQQEQILREVVNYSENDSNVLKYKFPIKDPLVRMVQSMFEYVLGSPRPQRYIDETNEYLSAVVAVKTLRNTLSLKHLFQIAACIEASIPFRPILDGKSPMGSLFHLLERTNEEFSVSLSEQELIETVQMAAFFANCDLGSFCAPDVQVLLNNTWKLLPEWKPVLLRPEKCKLQDVFEMFVMLQQRYQNINTKRIFQCFRGTPSQEGIDGMLAQAKENLNVVAQYVKIRMLTVRALKDFLLVVGGRTYENMLAANGGALSFLKQVEEGVDVPLPKCDDFDDDKVYRCLVEKQRSSSSWDANCTRSSAAIYVSMEWKDIEATEDVAIGRGDLVRLIPASVSVSLGQAAAKALPARYAEAINKASETCSTF